MHDMSENFQGNTFLNKEHIARSRPNIELADYTASELSSNLEDYSPLLPIHSASRL